MSEPRTDTTQEPGTAAAEERSDVATHAQTANEASTPTNAETDQPAGAAADHPPVDTIPDWPELLKQAERQAAEHYDAWLRAKAEVENTRRRAEEEITKARIYAITQFAAALLPVKDSLEAALATENQTVESLREGVALTLRQLTAALENHGVREENPQGGKFDPNRHQAIGMIETDGEPNQVAQVLQKGYLLHERVLRPALVMVSQPKTSS